MGCQRKMRSSTRFEDLLTKKYPNQKVLIFTQFADTVDYVTQQLKARGVSKAGGRDAATPKTQPTSPTGSARRATESETEINPEDELRVLIATDVLSEGQNLQDCAVVVNYDLPWAIIRLIQRAGRVDRIGQKSDKYLLSFLFARRWSRKDHSASRRVRQRLQGERRSRR